MTATAPTQQAPPAKATAAAPKTAEQAAAERRQWDEMRQRVAVGARGLEFSDWSQLAAFCQTISQGTLVPMDCRNQPANCLIKAQMGQSLGLDAMTAIWNIDVIEGRPSLPVRLKLAICRRSRMFDEAAFSISYAGTPFADEYTCSVSVRRKPDGEPYVGQFSVADAKRAGLWEKKSKDGKPLPWSMYPKDMLFARACSRAIDREFSDITLGMYSQEDMEVDRAMDAIDLTARPMTHEEAMRALTTDPTSESEAEQPEESAAMPPFDGPDQQQEEQPEQPLPAQTASMQPTQARQPNREPAPVQHPAPAPAAPAPAGNDRLAQANAYAKIRSAFMALPQQDKAAVRQRFGIQIITDLRSWPLDKLEEVIDLLAPANG